MAASWQPPCALGCPISPDVEQLLSSPDGIKEDVIQNADHIVFTNNPAVLPDGSNINEAPYPETVPSLHSLRSPHNALTSKYCHSVCDSRPHTWVSDSRPV